MHNLPYYTQTRFSRTVAKPLKILFFCKVIFMLYSGISEVRLFDMCWKPGF